MWNSAFALLLVTGGFLGLIFPFGKLVGEAGVPPIVWATVISFGTGTVLGAWQIVFGGGMRCSMRHLRYFAIAGLVSYAAPNVIVFFVIPKIGAGLTGMMFTLSPLFTLAFSAALGMRTVSLAGMIGIATGFIGAIVVVTTRQPMAAVPIDTGWTVVALVIPMLLAAGNVYRTLDWPPATGPILLAAGSHLAAALGLVIALAAFGNPADVATLSRVLGLTTAQVMASVAMFVFFFRLQAVGGPVYLSQISYVAAAVALISGLLFLGESYSVTTWAGALIVCIGIAITTRAQRSATV